MMGEAMHIWWAAVDGLFSLSFPLIAGVYVYRLVRKI